MAAIYQADIWCDDCAELIRNRICDELWSRRDCHGRHDTPFCPNDTLVAEFESRDDLADYLEGMDERFYDSGEYPKHCGDNEESDCPQHCAGGEDCVNAEVGSDGTKYGCFFGNDLTSDGINYVREAVREDLRAGFNDSPAVEFWAPFYDYIDFEDDDSAPG
jgi:hypothetical protein